VPEPKAPQPAAPAPSKPNLPPVTVPSVPPVSVGGRQDDTPQTRENQAKLLDYLLGP
jgi:hypothetical protein